MGNTGSILPYSTNKNKKSELINTKRCNLCQKLINLNSSIFYNHDSLNHTIYRCYYDKGVTHITNTFPTTIIDKDNFTACEECCEINSLAPPLIIQQKENYTCSLCKKIVNAYFKSNSNATSRFESFLCRDCFKNFCCYDDCNRQGTKICSLCNIGYCNKHILRHTNTIRNKELEGIKSYSCRNTRLNIDFYEAEILEY